MAADAQKPNTPPTAGRRPWSAPKLAEYGHIGKLTQGSSGKNTETTGKMIAPCL
jgi:hypothetical protein